MPAAIAPVKASDRAYWRHSKLCHKTKQWLQPSVLQAHNVFVLRLASGSQPESVVARGLGVEGSPSRGQGSPRLGPLDAASSTPANNYHNWSSPFSGTEAFTNQNPQQIYAKCHKIAVQTTLASLQSEKFRSSPFLVISSLVLCHASHCKPFTTNCH